MKRSGDGLFAPGTLGGVSLSGPVREIVVEPIEVPVPAPKPVPVPAT